MLRAKEALVLFGGALALLYITSPSVFLFYAGLYHKLEVKTVISKAHAEPAQTKGHAPPLDPGPRQHSQGYYAVLTAELSGKHYYTVTYHDEQGQVQMARFQDWCKPVPNRTIWVETIEYPRWPKGRQSYARCGNGVPQGMTTADVNKKNE